MADGLRALGHDVQVVELDGRLPDPDQAAIYAARTAWSALPKDAMRLIDGLALPAFNGVPLHQVTALVHHPASLETGLATATAQRLHAIEAAMFREVPRLVTTSEQTAERLVSGYGTPADRIRVVIPGIDILPHSPGSGGPGCHILSVGGQVPRKGHDVLLRALGRLFDLDWTLTIAGTADRDPVYAAGLRALAEDLAVARRVAFADDVDETLWASADLFALTSYFEGYGVAIAEAMRRGLTVAVTNVGAVPTLVGPEAVRRLVFDRGLRQDMAEVAWRTGQSLPSWNEQAVQLAAITG
jgi:glycosyltransferase involved in cell wall biosynthesis